MRDWSKDRVHDSRCNCELCEEINKQTRDTPRTEKQRLSISERLEDSALRGMFY